MGQIIKRTFTCMRCKQKVENYTSNVGNKKKKCKRCIDRDAYLKKLKEKKK